MSNFCYDCRYFELEDPRRKIGTCMYRGVFTAETPACEHFCEQVPITSSEEAQTMYESPIELFIKDVTQSVIEQRENTVYASIVENFGINVDKDELIKALNYDRGQYNKGYADGYRRGLEEGKRDAYLILAEKLQEMYGGDHG